MECREEKHGPSCQPSSSSSSRSCHKRVQAYDNTYDPKDYLDIPLDTDDSQASKFRAKRQALLDKRHLQSQLQNFTKEYYGDQIKKSLEEPTFDIIDVDDFDLARHVELSLMCTAVRASCAYPRSLNETFSIPKIVHQEITSASQLWTLVCTCKRPFDPIHSASSLLSQLNPSLQEMTLTFLTGFDAVRTRAMYEAMRSPLEEFDLKNVAGASSMRSKALFVERYRQAVYDSQEKAKKSAFFLNTPQKSFKEWAKEYQAALTPPTGHRKVPRRSELARHLAEEAKANEC